MLDFVMGLWPPVDEAGTIFHVPNRCYARGAIFHKGDDYEAIVRILAEDLSRRVALLSKLSQWFWFSSEEFCFTIQTSSQFE